jgi:cell division cycle 20-like protein 1 (cofactor of APC complex)
MLASGGNDNKLLLWSLKCNQPLFRLKGHTAAVKAIAWSQDTHGLLVSGGGTADRSIRFWNALSMQELSCYDAGSQVCNLLFTSRNNQTQAKGELLSTHGYSHN